MCRQIQKKKKMSGDSHLKSVDDCYNLLIDLMKNAGELAMEGYNLASKKVETKKGSWDVVTYYDKAIEDLFIERIRHLYPQHK